MTVERDSSFELLRLLLMLLIVVGHALVHGLHIYDIHAIHESIHSDDVFLFYSVGSFCAVAVNTFVLISGYYGLKPTFEKILKLLLAVLFYDLIFNIGYSFLIGDYRHSVAYMFVISLTPYWFIRNYLFLMCFTPLINGAFERMAKRQTSLFVVSLAIMSGYFGFVWQDGVNPSGFSLIQFIMLYSIGRYIATYNINLKKTYAALIYVLCSLVCGGSMYLLYHYFDLSFWKMTYYNNPLIIISSIAVLLLFKNIHFNSPFINKAAKSALAIYLFHESIAVGKWYHSLVSDIYTGHANILHASVRNGGVFLLLIIALALAIMIVSIMIDQIQIKINYKFSNYILNKWRYSERK